MLQVMHAEPAVLLRGIGFTLGNYTYPIMLMDYMGQPERLSQPTLHGVVRAPACWPARLEPIFFSALTIVLAFALARAWFGRGVAAVTALLLAVNPSFIWFSRQGISVTSVMTVFSLGRPALAGPMETKGDERLEIRDSRFEIREWRSVNQQPSIPNLQSPFPIL